MSDKPNHYAECKPTGLTHKVYYKDELILESDQVIEVVETYGNKKFHPVYYFKSISNLEVKKTDHASTCPIKGAATYWTYKDAENGIWSYQDPTPEVSAIKGYFSFDKSKGFRVE